MNTEAPKFLWKIEYVGRQIDRNGRFEERVMYM
jgi:hypothetical protein